MVNKGFSILELVVAIFIITVAVGTGLLIIAGNLNLMQKSNEMLIASAIAQYHIELVKTIDFPPVYYDRQSEFPKKISEGDNLSVESSINPDFKVYMGCIWYKADGTEASNTETDNVVLRKIKIEVRRSKDNYPIISMPIFIARNGVY